MTSCKISDSHRTQRNCSLLRGRLYVRFTCVQTWLDKTYLPQESCRYDRRPGARLFGEYILLCSRASGMPSRPPLRYAFSNVRGQSWGLQPTRPLYPVSPNPTYHEPPKEGWILTGKGSSLTQMPSYRNISSWDTFEYASTLPPFPYFSICRYIRLGFEHLHDFFGRQLRRHGVLPGDNPSISYTARCPRVCLAEIRAKLDQLFLQEEGHFVGQSHLQEHVRKNDYGKNQHVAKK